jgi:hypothetical protein
VLNRLSTDAVRSALQGFQIQGEFVECHPHERGHIHDTFISTWGSGEKVRRYLHQRMNETVFRDIPALMHNIERISRHMLEKQGAADSLDGFHVLDLVPTTEGKSYLCTSSGPWRTYHYIENSTSYDICSSEERAFEAARAFGWFQAQLVDLKAGELKETLPRFFSPPHRLTQFDKALAGDPSGRAGSCVAEIRFVEERRNTVQIVEQELEAGSIPTRIVHGDTKLNNILFDNATGVAKSIVDLDTCMPAWSLYDFGDLVRFTAATSGEDERDLEKVGTDFRLYRALVNGYLENAREFLTPREIELMPYAARLVTFTIGLRFLTDYLDGDIYFKTERTAQNLDRARVQFKMVEGMEQREEDMVVR